MFFYPLPVNTADNPVELIGREGPGGLIYPRPAKVAFVHVQTANAQPDAVFIPAQHMRIPPGRKSVTGSFTAGEKDSAGGDASVI